MAQGIFATPDIGNAGAESYQVAATAVDTSGIKTSGEIFASNAAPVIYGSRGVAAYGESKVLKSEAEELAEQIKAGFQQDAPSQAAGQSLGELKSAVEQGQISNSSAILRMQAIKAKAQGLSPVYGAEIEDVFAKNGLDSNGRNALGSSKADFQQSQALDKIKTVQTWQRDPTMSQYVIYQPGTDPTEDNINVQATLDNVAKVNNAKRAADAGSTNTLNAVMTSYNEQTANVINQMADQYQALASSGAPAGQVAVKAEELYASHVTQVNKGISYLQQQQAKFSVGTDQYKAIDDAITRARASLNDFKTFTPKQLVASNTAAKMIQNQVAVVSGKQEINYVTTIKPYVQLAAIAPASVLTQDNGQEFSTIKDKMARGISLTPYEEAINGQLQTNHSWGTYLASNLGKGSYMEVDAPAVSTVAGYDSKAVFNWVQGLIVTPEDKQKAAKMSARLFDGMANTSSFIKNPSNYSKVLQSTANPSYVDDMLNHTEKGQKQYVANNVITMANTALTGAGLPFSIPTLKSNGVKIIIDTRTNTINFKPQGDINKLQTLTGTANVVPGNLYSDAQQVWNNGLQTMQNVSSYDSQLKGKSKAEIALEILQQNDYPENMIEIKQ